MRLKVAIVIILLILAAVFENLLMGVTVGNAVAVNQVNDTVGSYAALHAYDGLRNWYWIVYPLIIVLTFSKEIIQFFKGEGK